MWHLEVVALNSQQWKGPFLEIKHKTNPLETAGTLQEHSGGKATPSLLLDSKQNKPSLETKTWMWMEAVLIENTAKCQLMLAVGAINQHPNK